MKLYIIRHGDPNYELDCLTEIGKEQAEAVAPRIASYGIDRIITSHARQRLTRALNPSNHPSTSTKKKRKKPKHSS